MTPILTGLTLACSVTILSASTAMAGPVGQACVAAGRQASNWRLCDCIQDVADQMLTRSDQRLAARFFAEPHKAQEIRQSDNPKHEAFWLRYKEFGAAAAALCD